MKIWKKLLKRKTKFEKTTKIEKVPSIYPNKAKRNKTIDEMMAEILEWNSHIFVKSIEKEYIYKMRTKFT